MSQIGPNDIKQFVAGTKAVASEVNSNFDVLKNAINDNDTRLTTAETNITNTNNDLVAGFNGRPRKNYINNGAMRIAQRCPLGNSKSLTTSAQYVLDRFYTYANATTLTAGTIKQISAVNGFDYGLKFEGVTLSGTNTSLITGQRLESLDSTILKNMAISIRADLYQDTGASINVTLNTAVPTVKDTFSAVTSTSQGAKALPSGTKTTLKWENITLGDCTNGLQVEFNAVMGAVTTKNLIISNIKLEIGDKCTDFGYKDIGDEIQDCKRYYRKSYDLDALPGAVTTNGRIQVHGLSTTTNHIIFVPFDVPMRIPPTITTYDAAGASGKVTRGSSSVTADIENVGVNGFVGGDKATTVTNDNTLFHYVAEAEL